MWFITISINSAMVYYCSDPFSHQGFASHCAYKRRRYEEKQYADWEPGGGGQLYNIQEDDMFGNPNSSMEIERMMKIFIIEDGFACYCAYKRRRYGEKQSADWEYLHESRNRYLTSRPVDTLSSRDARDVVSDLCREIQVRVAISCGKISSRSTLSAHNPKVKCTAVTALMSCVLLHVDLHESRNRYLTSRPVDTLSSRDARDVVSDLCREIQVRVAISCGKISSRSTLSAHNPKVKCTAVTALMAVSAMAVSFGYQRP
nr:hypothetical protein [Tanacetum cinerariifolium]